MQVLNIHPWEDYELIDVGNHKKIERFGAYMLIRPEPQALWRLKKDDTFWKKKVHTEFIQKGSNSGQWIKYKNIPDRWYISFALEDGVCMKLRLSLTGFKHIGVFPEQSFNWKDIYFFLKEIKEGQMLNLFAYTGAASIVGALAGAKVTHIDSVKQIVNWANDNAQLNGLNNIRWIVEDAMTFVKKQLKKGLHYHCIVLDPPAYGHGPHGEKWNLEELIDEMMQNVLQLLHPHKHLLILNVYSLGLSASVLRNLLIDYAHQHDSQLEYGEIRILSTSGYYLPLGVFGKIRKV